MAFQSRTYRALIASPSDLIEERRIATEAINEWNVQHSEAEGVVLLAVKFETHAMPQAGIRPQQAINQQLVSKCDILIGMFWTKYGSNTGVAESGTVEEIDQVVAAGKPVLLYFSTRPVDPSKIDPDQHVKLKRFKEETYQTALVGTFSDLNELHRTVLRDLVQLVRKLKSTDRLQLEDEADAKEQRRESLANAKTLIGPHANIFRTPTLSFMTGSTEASRRHIAREPLFGFVKETARQNHLIPTHERFELNNEKNSLFKNPTIQRHQGNVCCFEDTRKSDPWGSGDIRMQTAKFISFDQYGFFFGQIALPMREYATRFLPGGGAGDVVDSYCFWHIVLYLRHLLAWATEFYARLLPRNDIVLTVSVDGLLGQPLKLIYGVGPPHRTGVSEVTTEDLHLTLEQLATEPALVTATVCYELLWSLGDEPISKEEVTRLVELLWDGRDS